MLLCKHTNPLTSHHSNGMCIHTRSPNTHNVIKIAPTQHHHTLATSTHDVIIPCPQRESESCFTAIRSSWAAILEVGSTKEGLRHLSTDFHMCGHLNDPWELVDWLEGAYSYLAMVDYPLPADFLMPLPAYPVREVCGNRNVGCLCTTMFAVLCVCVCVCIYLT